MEKLSRRIVIGAAALGGLSAKAFCGPGPHTLFDLSGIHPAPARLSEATLIVIDAQGEYRKGSLRLDGMEPAMLVLAAVLDRARAAGTPIVHVAHRGDPGGLFDRSRYGGRILPEAAPHAGEALVEKLLPNAFARTGLQARLKAIGRRKLIVVGFMTHMCVSSTVRARLRPRLRGHRRRRTPRRPAPCLRRPAAARFSPPRFRPQPWRPWPTTRSDHLQPASVGLKRHAVRHS